MSKRRILYVEQNVDGTVGGSYFTLLDIVRAIDRDRFEPVVLFHRDNPVRPRFDEECRTIVWRPPAGRLAGLLGRARLVCRERAAIVHLNNDVTTGPEWIWASRLAGVPCVSHQRGRARLTRRSRFHARQLDAVVAIAEFLARELREQGIAGERIATIHDGIDPRRVRGGATRGRGETRASLGIDPERPLVGMVGNIKPWKGQHVLAKALPAIAEAVPDVACVFLGETSPARPREEAYLGEVRRAIGEAGLEDRTVFAGFRTDAHDVIRALDLLVHASIEPEPLGRVILEGMVLGTPVVASAAGGPLEIVETGVSGILVPPGDDTALAAAAVALLLDPAGRAAMTDAARRRIDECFLLADRIDDLEDVYERIARARA